MSNPILWEPDPAAVPKTQLDRFRRRIEERTQRLIADSAALHAWSVREPAEFWDAIWDELEVIGTKGEPVVTHFDRMPGARWFPQGRLNFAENLLRSEHASPAVVFCNENGSQRTMSRTALRDEVSRVAQAYRDAGVNIGDRIGAYIPNMPEAIIYMLAASSIGATWSSSSPDFGPSGVVDRFGQIEPKLLVTVDAYQYGGKVFPMDQKVEAVLRELPSVKRTIVVPYMGRGELEAPATVTHADFVGPFEPRPLTFEPLPFDHPLYVLYSSGTNASRTTTS